MPTLIKRNCIDCGADISFESIDEQYGGLEPGSTWDKFLWRCDGCIELDRKAEDRKDRSALVKSLNIPPEMMEPWDQSKAGCGESVKRSVVGWRPMEYKRGLWISGDESGLCKTRLACILGVDLAMEMNSNLVFTSFPHIAWELSAFRSDQKLEKLVEKCKSARVLILDDVGGKETATERVLQALYLIVNHRYLNQMITIATSNYKANCLDQIPKKSEGTQLQAIMERVENTYTKIHIASQKDMDPF